MSTSEKNLLMLEYVKKYSTTFRILEISGFCRFIIRNGKIVERNWISVLYNIFVMIMIDTSAAVMLWTANISEETLSTVEFAAITHFAIFSNLLLCHITFGDKSRGPKLMERCIEIDCYLDAKETEFMRDRTIKMYRFTVMLIGISQVMIVTYLYYLFHVSFIVHVFGSLYFFWIFFAYDDFCFFLYLNWFLTTRTYYLNVALIKISIMNRDYIPKQWLFQRLFWNDNDDDRVTFHEKNSRDFNVAFKMLFNLLRCIEQCYRFPIILGFSTVIMGTFVTVQTFIMYIEASTAMARASVITCWAIASWFYMLILGIFPDMFYKQVEQTKLICAYIQLKPSSSGEMLKLTKDILATLELRGVRVLSYGLLSVGTDLILKLAASTFVYITVQLQMAFPNLEDGHRVENVTKPTMFELDRSAVKDYLFLY